MKLYVNALINKYLLIYRDRPDEFFANAEEIKAEMKECIDLMLYGIAIKE